jgi:hypothetical protein
MSRTVLAAVALLALEGRAQASAFSMTVTPFPTGAIYVPEDPADPLLSFVWTGGGYAYGDDGFSFNYGGTLECTGACAAAYGGPFTVTGSADLIADPDPGSSFATGGSFVTFVNNFNFSSQPMFGLTLAFLRQSTLTPSTGTMTAVGTPGNFIISSFFDVFTEISLDGSNWAPGPSMSFELQSEDQLEAVPEPGTLFLFGAGALLLARTARRRAPVSGR